MIVAMRHAMAWLAVLVMTGCAWLDRAEPWVTAGPVAVTGLPGWLGEDGAGLRQALLAQCARASVLGARWVALCQEIEALPDAIPAAVPGGPDTPAADPLLRDWVAARFDAWSLTAPGGSSIGLLTGYYEPVMTGTRERRNAGQVALYALPPAGTPARSATRAAIADGDHAQALDGLELVWLDDPVDAFFLHIQGSGRVALPDGEVLRLGFAGHNNQPYGAIGRALIDRGAIARQDMSAQAIRQWLADHADQAQAVMNLNPRFVFFRRHDAHADTGPTGSLGVPLTPGRSVATDRQYLPPGALLWMRSRSSDANVDTRASARLAVSQDTGGAIRGAVRADLYTGTGEPAGETAGRLRDRLQVWLLWPRGAMPPGRIPFARPIVDN